MADDTTQGQDRVADVDVIVGSFNDQPTTETTPRNVAEHVVRTLDNAGLLLTAARRERIVEFIQHAGPEYIDPVSAERHERHRDALLRELAGDRGAAETFADLVARVRPPGAAVLAGSGTVASEPTPAPRRMAGIPGATWPSPHAGEHDERPDCAVGTPCQPVAAVKEWPGGASVPGHPDFLGNLSPEIRERREYDENADPIREGRIIDYIDEHGVEWTRSERVRRSLHSTPAHEHRWAAVAGDAWTGNERGCFGWRVTREHCVVGDCTATREVGHGG